jgi:hypothetical protein
MWPGGHGGEKEMPICNRCDFEASKFEDYRFRAGNWTVREEGEVKEYKILCEDCYRTLFK